MPKPLLTFTARAVTDLREIDRRSYAKRGKLLFRFGGYGLRTLRNSIKTRKSTSREGSPPHSKTRAFKRNSRFEVDRGRTKVETGFTVFPSAVASPLGGQTVDGVIDSGGYERLTISARTIARPDGELREVGPKTVTARFGPRPVVGPAQQAAAPKFRELVASIPY